MKTRSITNSINPSSFYHVVKVSVHPFTVWILAQMMTAGVALSQVLTHGPVVGGVTASTANVFVRTDQGASVVLWYGTDPNLEASLISETAQTSSANDFTKIIPLAKLTGETTYYMNVVGNGMPQSASPPYPLFHDVCFRRDFQELQLCGADGLRDCLQTNRQRADLCERSSKKAGLCIHWRRL